MEHVTLNIREALHGVALKMSQPVIGKRSKILAKESCAFSKPMIMLTGMPQEQGKRQLENALLVTLGSRSETAPTMGINHFWGVILSPCSPIYCNADLELSVNWPQSSPGQNVTGTCKTGFYGFPTRSCLQVGNQGVWSAVQNPCQEILCDNVTYANAEWESVRAGSFQNGICSPGFYGNPQRLCNQNGTQGVWSTGISGSCQVLYCSATSDGSSSWSQADANTNATGTCLSGFTGTPRRTCELDDYNNEAVWGNIVDDCVPVTCPSEDFGNATWPESSLGNANGVCDSGFEGSPIRECLLVNGGAQWS